MKKNQFDLEQLKKTNKPSVNTRVFLAYYLILAQKNVPSYARKVRSPSDEKTDPLEKVTPAKASLAVNHLRYNSLHRAFFVILRNDSTPVPLFRRQSRKYPGNIRGGLPAY